MAEKITSAKKCRRDTMILLFTSAITSAFAECRRELERLFTSDFHPNFSAFCDFSNILALYIEVILVISLFGNPKNTV